MTDRTLLVDADFVLHRACVVASEEIRWTDDVHTIHVNVQQAKDKIQADIKRAMDETECDAFIVCLSCPGAENWRYKVLPTYKNNRAETLKPPGFYAVRDWLKDLGLTYERPTLEADDVMGILATHPKAVEGEKVIYSRDKDMKTIPGTLWNEVSLMTISEAEADLWHLKQALMGDKTDGYDGCPGIGPVTAEKLLRGASDPWAVIVQQYAKKGISADVALQMARVARICRATDYDMRQKEVILWNP